MSRAADGCPARRSASGGAVLPCGATVRQQDRPVRVKAASSGASDCHLPVFCRVNPDEHMLTAVLFLLARRWAAAIICMSVGGRLSTLVHLRSDNHHEAIGWPSESCMEARSDFPRCGSRIAAACRGRYKEGGREDQGSPRGRPQCSEGALLRFHCHGHDERPGLHLAAGTQYRGRQQDDVAVLVEVLAMAITRTCFLASPAIRSRTILQTRTTSVSSNGAERAGLLSSNASRPRFD